MTDVAPSHRLDSGIDVSLCPEEESDNDIIDFDRVSLFDEDEETWLRGSKKKSSGKEDVMSWLRSKASFLDNQSRQALIRKLDAISKKNVKCTIDSDDEEEETFFDAVDQDKLFPSESIKQGEKSEPKTALHDFIVPKKPDFFARPQKMTVLLPAPIPDPTEVTTPDFLACEARFGIGDNVDNGGLSVSVMDRLPKDKSPSPRLLANPELQDIHLLASMQEDDLRQCLERMQMQRRRRTESVNSDTNPVAHALNQQPGVSQAALDQLAVALGKNKQGTPGGVASTSGRRARDDKYKTYSKRSAPVTQTAARVDSSAPTPGRRSAPARSNPIAVNERRNTDVIKRPAIDPPTKPKPTGLYAQPSESLQKSLPNLTSSKSGELSVARANETTSENGSYTDIPNSLTHVTPARPPSRLRMPTPRSRLLTPGRTAIPAPASRNKSPGSQMQRRIVAQRQQWNEDCF